MKPFSQMSKNESSNLKMNASQLANLNAVGLDEQSKASFLKGDLYETLYKQNVSLFSIKDQMHQDQSLSQISTKDLKDVSLLSNKDFCTLSTDFKIKKC